MIGRERFVDGHTETGADSVAVGVGVVVAVGERIGADVAAAAVVSVLVVVAVVVVEDSMVVECTKAALVIGARRVETAAVRWYCIETDFVVGGSQDRVVVEIAGRVVGENGKCWEKFCLHFRC